MKQQNEIINKNQQNLAKILSNPPAKPAKPSNNKKAENLQLLNELLRPINSQLEQISMKYEELKKDLKEFQMKPASMESPEELNLKKRDLKQNLEQVIGDLEELKPEHSEALLSKFSKDFDRETYATSILRLQGKMRGIEAELARIEPIQKRAKEGIEKTVGSIDLQAGYENIIKRLGGEFDYQGWESEIEGIKGEFYREIENFRENNENFVDFQRVYGDLLKEIKTEKNQKKTKKQENYEKIGVLDKFKEKIGYDEKKFIKKEAVQEEKKGVLAKKTTNKPKSLSKITTVPKNCPQDIAFKKKKEEYETIFDAKDKKANKAQIYDNYNREEKENLFKKKEYIEKTRNFPEENKEENELKDEELEENTKVFISGKKMNRNQEDSSFNE